MGELPRHQSDLTAVKKRRSREHRRFSWVFFALSFVALFYLPPYWKIYFTPGTSEQLPLDAGHVLSRCAELKALPGFPKDFYARTQSDRFQAGTKATLIQNATLWTGGDDGTEIITGDILMDGGIIKWVGNAGLEKVKSIYGRTVDIVDAQGAWTTPGIVDLHSHLGVNSAPALSGADDTNSFWGITQPWLRSIDGLNTHDDAYTLSISGGVTSANILPGSADAIGGQAFPIKLRPTVERSASSKLIEQPGSPNATGWRQMKHACGENPRFYDGTRMDTIWSFRAAYNEARLLVHKQDKFCVAASAGQWSGLDEFPEDLKWEALADVIRGKVKVHNHCYEAVDFDGIVRLSNEFQFPIAAFHHAHEAYLVPDLIKKAWGPTPAIAIFATNGRYKREAWRGSEFAARILAKNGLRVVMKSDHPVLDSRFLLYEAQQAHFYGLPADVALSSVTTTPANVLGLGHRIGYLKENYDADIVLWDSHPLALGATPKQVYIDGIPQLTAPYGNEKAVSFQKLPKTPNFDKEAADAVKYEGLPPLTPPKNVPNVIFTNVQSVWSRIEGNIGVEQTFTASTHKTDSYRGDTVAIVENGRITCTGSASTCQVANLVGYESVDLEGGSLAPGLTSFGAPLGLGEIAGEASTQDGRVFDPLSGTVPSIVGGDGSVIKAADGLEFGTRDALLAYRSGVTAAISAPEHSGVFAGLGSLFSAGATNKLERGAVIQETTALHVSIGHSPGGIPSVSTQIATLRRLLFGSGEGELKKLFDAVANGKLTLVVNVEAANIIATLVTLKKEVEEKTGQILKLTLAGASESHLLARELGEAGVGVILIPSRPFPATWEQRQILPGPPLSEESAIAILISHNVTVGIGIVETWSARNTRFDAAWAALESPRQISKKQAFEIVSTNLEKLLGAYIPATHGDIVAYRGGDAFTLNSKVVGVISPRRGSVDLL
ncbi:hypothetical protein K439DRAFT_1627298 [Ramaria rubella]|nr:hypothetical protein K439DRAFT_1627298 [Ramaria rubella]